MIYVLVRGGFIHLKNLASIVLDNGMVHVLVQGEEGGKIFSQVHPEQFAHQIQLPVLRYFTHVASHNFGAVFNSCFKYYMTYCKKDILELKNIGMLQGLECGDFS